MHKSLLDELKPAQVSFSTIAKFPVFVLWLVLVHILIFYIIPRNSYPCQFREGDNPRACSMLNTGYTVFFYFIWLIYFFLQAL